MHCRLLCIAISCALQACIASVHCQCALPVCPISVTSHGERGSILCKCHAHSSTLWDCLLVSTLIQSLWKWCTFHCSPLLSEISPSHFHLHFYFNFHIFFAHCAWSIGHALKMETERKPSQLVGDQVIKHFHTFHFLTLISLCSLFTFTFLFTFHFASAQMHWHRDLAWRQRKCFMQASTCAHKHTTQVENSLVAFCFIFPFQLSLFPFSVQPIWLFFNFYFSLKRQRKCLNSTRASTLRWPCSSGNIRCNWKQFHFQFLPVLYEQTVYVQACMPFKLYNDL